MHRQFAVGIAGPVGLIAVAVQLHAIAIGVTQIDGLADTMVGGPVNGDACGNHAGKGSPQRGAVRIQKRGVIQAGMAGGWGGATGAFPSVQANVVVVIACGKEGGLVAVMLLDAKAKDAGIKGDGAVKIGDLEVDMTDTGGGVSSWHFGLLCVYANIRPICGQTSGCFAQVLRKKVPPDPGAGPRANAAGAWP
jgi:hypothetical protein